MAISLSHAEMLLCLLLLGAFVQRVESKYGLDAEKADCTDCLHQSVMSLSDEVYDKNISGLGYTTNSCKALPAFVSLAQIFNNGQSAAFSVFYVDSTLLELDIRARNGVFKLWEVTDSAVFNGSGKDLNGIISNITLEDTRYLTRVISGDDRGQTSLHLKNPITPGAYLIQLYGNSSELGTPAEKSDKYYPTTVASDDKSVADVAGGVPRGGTSGDHGKSAATNNSVDSAVSGGGGNAATGVVGGGDAAVVGGGNAAAGNGGGSNDDVEASVNAGAAAVSPPSATISGLSQINFDINFMNPVDMRHLKSEPMAGDTTLLTAQLECTHLFGNISDLVFYSEDGKTLAHVESPQQLSQSEGTYIFHIVTPRQPFHVSLVGFDAKGNKFRRIHPQLVRPSTVGLSFATPAFTENLSPKQILNIQLRLRNKGTGDTFNIGAKFATYMDYLKAHIDPEILEVNQDETKVIDIFISVDKSVSQKIVSSLTVFVTRKSDGCESKLEKSVTAMPMSFGDDKLPPSCKVTEWWSACDSTEACHKRTWRARASVKDASGVFRASLVNTNSLFFLEYKTVHGRVMVKAYFEHNCCVQNASLQVEDYIGNKKTCTVTSPGYDDTTADFGNVSNETEKLGPTPSAWVPSVKNKNKTTTSTFVPKAGGGEIAEQPLGTKVESIATTTLVTPIRKDSNEKEEEPARKPGEKGSEDASNENRDGKRKYTGFWSPSQLEKLKILGPTLLCALLLIITIVAVRRHVDKKHRKQTAAYRFGKGKSARTNRTGASKDQIGKNHFSSEHAMSTTATSVHSRRRNAETGERSSLGAGSSEPASDYCEGESRCLSADRESGFQDGCVKETSFQDSQSSQANETSSRSTLGRATQPSENGDVAEEASTVKWLSQIVSSDFQLQNKVEIYESILQFKQTLGQLEKKSAALMSAMSFRNNTVPRVKQRSNRTPLDMDVESDNQPDHQGPKHSTEPSSPVMTRSVSSRSGQGEIPPPDVFTLGVGRGNLSNQRGSTLDDSGKVDDSEKNPTTQSSMNPANATNTNRSVIVDSASVAPNRNVNSVGPDADSSVPLASTLPQRSHLELSQRQVGMLIEGATQVSLRHVIEDLRERLVHSNKVVEDALQHERSRFNDLGDLDGVDDDDFDSDFEEI